MSFLREWRGFFLRMRSWTPFGFEIGVIAMSFYAAAVLLTHPDYFETNLAAYATISSLMSAEWKWGGLALVAALLKSVGFLGFFARSEKGVARAFALRAAGWGCSAVLWTCLGVTVLCWNPVALNSAVTLLLGVFCIGMVLTGPVTPERDDG